MQSSVRRITSNQIHCRGYHLGHISFKNAIPILSEAGCQWIASKTGEQVSFDRFHVDSGTWPLHLQLHNTPENMYALPPRPLVEKTLLAYRACAFCLAFPVIDHVLFERTIDIAYSTTGEPLLSHMSAKACVLAFMAISPMFQMVPADLKLREGDEFAAKANQTLSHCLEETTLVTLQAAFMLVSSAMSAAMNWISLTKTNLVYASSIFRPTPDGVESPGHGLSDDLPARRARVQADCAHHW
jgi:hypothetical protein